MKPYIYYHHPSPGPGRACICGQFYNLKNHRARPIHHARHTPTDSRLNDDHARSFGLSIQTETDFGIDIGALGYRLTPDSLDGQANMAGGVVYKDFFESDMFTGPDLAFSAVM